MNEHEILVVEIPEIENHPDADALGIVRFDGVTIVINDQWKTGDKAVLIPSDFIVPAIPAFAFLGDKPKHRRIKPKKLRGVWSEGLLMPVTELPDIVVDHPYWGKHFDTFDKIPVGFDVMGLLGIERYDFENKEHNPSYVDSGDPLTCEPPGLCISKYSLHPYKKYASKLVLGDEVVITEKIHGTNHKMVYSSTDNKLYIGSRTQWKDPLFLTSPHTRMQTCANGQVALCWCQDNPDKVLFGEVFGWVAGLRYGAEQGKLFYRAFDVWNNITKEWEEVPDELQEIKVPELYRGPWDPAIAESLVDGQSTIPGANHIREGIVIEPTNGKRDAHIGRRKFKYVSNTFLSLGK